VVVDGSLIFSRQALGFWARLGGGFPSEERVVQIIRARLGRSS
jgi:hypothetical protein